MKYKSIKNSWRHACRRPLQRALLPLLFSMLMSSCSSRLALAQTVTAAINGTITDTTKSPIVGASIIVTDVDRGVTFTATSNQSGGYNLPVLPVGTYTEKISTPGFQTEALPPFTLVLNQVAKLDFTMKVGSVHQTVNVTSQAPLLQTQTTQVSTIIDARTNVSLPLASRNYLQLALLSPGAISVNPAGMYNAQTILNSSQPYINGNRAQDNNFLIDGVTNNQTSDNLVAYSPSPDAIEEFNLITQNAPAQFGNFQGGIVSVSIKSGTNKFRGDLWEFFRNDKLNANGWGNDLLNAVNHSIVAPKEGLRWNMFGGTVGGPVLKNKLFFFADYQGQRFETVGSSQTFNAFTGPERAGDFGQLCTDPENGGGTFDGGGNCSAGHGEQVLDPFTGANVPFNNIGKYIASDVDPQLTAWYNSGGGKVAQGIFSSPYYPSVSSLLAGSGTASNPGIINNYVYQERDPFNVDQGDIKFDWAMSEKDHAFARYSREQQDNPVTASLPVVAVEKESGIIWNTALDWNHVFNPNVLNDLRGGVDWPQLNEISATNTPGNYGATLGIANATALPGLSPGPASSFGSNGQILNWADTVIQVGDNLQILHGSHSINIGFQLFRNRMDTFFAGGGGIYGEYSYGGNFSGTADTDFYLGMGNEQTQYFTNAPPGVLPAWGQRSWVSGEYFQDDWRVKDNLTLNLGVRYQVNTPWVEVHGRDANYDVISGQPYYPAGHPFPSTVPFPGLQPVAYPNHALYHGYYGIGDVEPRIGFAYTPGSSGGKMVIRGAYTISDFLEGTGNALRTTQNVPYNINILRENFCSGGTPGCDPTELATNNGIVPVLGNQFAGTRLNIWAQNVRPSMAQQWNLTAQRILAKNTTIQLSYTGQHATHLMVPLALLQKQLQSNGTVTPSPYLAGNPALKSTIGNIAATYSIASASYNAFQAVVKKQLSSGLEGQLAYVNSHCLTNAIGYYGDSGQSSSASAYWQDLYNPLPEWGSCYFDVTNALTAYAIYALPIGRGKVIGSNLNPIVNSILGNWSVSPIWTWHGGFPLTVTSNDHSGTSSEGPRADCNGPARYEKKLSTVGIQWFDPTVYSNPANGTFGTCGVSTVRGPGLDSVDISLQKDFPITKATYLQFRSEFINALNHPIFNAPSAYCGGSAGAACAAGLGLISSDQGARNIQFALKLYY